MTYLEWPTWSMQSSIRGSGKESALFRASTFLKSVQNLTLPSSFGTKRHGKLQALWLGSIKPLSNMYVTFCWSSFLFCGFTLYAYCLTGLASPMSTSWYITLVYMGESGNYWVYSRINHSNAAASFLSKWLSLLLKLTSTSELLSVIPVSHKYYLISFHSFMFSTNSIRDGCNHNSTWFLTIIVLLMVFFNMLMW